MRRTAAAGPGADARPAPRRPGAGARGGVRPAEGSARRGGAGSSSGTSTSRPAAASRSRRTTTPRRTRRTTQPGDDARAAVDDLLDEPFGNWHVETTTETHQLRVTKKLEAMVHTRRAAASRGRSRAGSTSRRPHDRAKPRLLPEDDPVLVALGISDAAGPGQAQPAGEVPPGRGVPPRASPPVVDDAIAAGRLRTPTAEEPLRVVDLGCGNAYLTFAAHALPRPACAACRCTPPAST